MTEQSEKRVKHVLAFTAGALSALGFILVLELFVGWSSENALFAAMLVFSVLYLGRAGVRKIIRGSGGEKGGSDD